MLGRERTIDDHETGDSFDEFIMSAPRRGDETIPATIEEGDDMLALLRLHEEAVDERRTLLILEDRDGPTFIFMEEGFFGHITGGELGTECDTIFGDFCDLTDHIIADDGLTVEIHTLGLIGVLMMFHGEL